jgi:RNA polymerase sigma-70 factor (ECF subfamily)
MNIRLQNVYQHSKCVYSEVAVKNSSAIDVEAYYVKYGPMVLRRCRSILKDEDAALDAMQEVFIRLLQKGDRLTGDFPSSLLYRIATNICLNMIRGGRSIPVSPDDALISAIAHTDDATERFITGDFIDYIFKGEHDSTRTMAYLHYVDGMTYDEVARETGLSVSGVRKRLRTFQEKVGHLKGEAL